MKYPAIYKSVEGSEYLYQNKDSYYCYERQLWDSSEPHHDCHHSDTNITAEYLANTYGEVKSKEHAEFIVKLAEVAKCAGLEVAKHKIANAESFKGIFFNFYNDNGTLWFAFHYEIQAKNRGEKQITIPLPPDCESVDEWPKVGEVVLTASKSKAKVLATYNKKAWVEYVSGSEGFNTLNIASLSKPKTPEQELRDFISLLWDENNHDFDMFLDIVTEHVIKKPQ